MSRPHFWLLESKNGPTNSEIVFSEKLFLAHYVREKCSIHYTKCYLLLFENESVVQADTFVYYLIEMPLAAKVNE